MSSGGDESVVIYDGTTKLYTTPTFSSNAERVVETCIKKTANLQYRVSLLDSGKNSWSNGAWVDIRGKYMNTFFKSFLKESTEENYALSLYYGIDKESFWKYNSALEEGWTTYSFSDTAWEDYTYSENSTAIVSGTQYYRYKFVGIPMMAAYECRIRYMYGVVVYVNGNEVFRDNMDDGPVTPTTPSTGIRNPMDYRGFMRTGSDITNAESVLAVELHFPNAIGVNSQDFDAWLSLLAASFEEENCSVFAYDMDITSSGTSGTKAFNWNKGDYMSMSSIGTDNYLEYSIGNGVVIPSVNGVRYYPNTYSSKAPLSFSLLGGSSTTTSSWTPVLSVSNWDVASKQYSLHMMYGESSFYRAFQFHFTEAAATPMYVVEMQLLVCNNLPPTEIVFEESSYSFLAKVDSIVIAPKRVGFSHCSVSPSLPQGLTMDANTCTISGIARSPLNSTLFTVTSALSTGNITGSFELSLSICEGTMIEIKRTYKNSAYQEAFVVTQSSTGSVLYSVGLDSGQVSSKDWSVLLCAPSGTITVELSGSASYWYSKSYMYIYSVFYSGESEEIAKIRYDNNLGLPLSYSFNPHYVIGSRSEWYMKFGEVPATWTDSSVQGWSQGIPLDAVSSSHIQLFKKTFTVDSLQNAASFILSIRYRHGCLVYLNGHEVFRRGLNSTLTPDSLSTNTFSSLVYHVVSLPFVTLSSNGESSATYLQSGSNTIAVAIVGASTSDTTVEFDLLLRLTGSNAESRILTASTSSSNVGTSANSIDLYYGTYISSTNCNTNYLDIYFPSDRREWINSILVQSYYSSLNYLVRQFSISGKNPEMDDYVHIATVTNLTWSIAGQTRKIWFENNVAYNRYRIKDIGTGGPESCSWRISRIDLVANSLVQEILALSYESTDIYKDIEMSELYPSSSLYTDFSITTELPEGIVLDPFEGVISGTATSYLDPVTYTVAARDIRGARTTATFTMGVVECANERSLMTVAIRADSYRTENSYRLYKGRGTSGQIVASADRFPVASTWIYVDRCLSFDIYTFVARDSRGNGWSSGAGYILTVDQGSFVTNMGMVPSGTAPVEVTTTFSSFLPFQRNKGTWRVLASNVALPNWASSLFDDSTWKDVPANAIGAVEPITTFIRKSFTLSNVEEYNVLNVNARFMGGLQAYFNGHLVARFNLPDTVTPSTLGLEKRSKDQWSQFHIVLHHSGVTEGLNVIGFEYHRSVGVSASSTVTFDATGVFGVEECSIVTDSWTDFTGSATTSTYYPQIFDLNPYTTKSISNTASTWMEFISENKIGSKFSEYGFYITSDVSSYSFSLYAYQDHADDLEKLSATSDQKLIAKTPNTFVTPLAILGFRHFRWEVDDSASSAPTIASVIFRSCKKRGEVCPGMGTFPSVAEGEISPIECNYGYSGYAYRICHNGTLSDIHWDRCVPKAPEYLAYPQKRFVFFKDLKSSTGKPSYENIITHFYLKEDDELPAGLRLDNTTGEITGVPSTVVKQSVVTVYGENEKGASETTIAFMVRQGECEPDGLYVRTKAGMTVTLDCALKGNYIGHQSRRCVLGENGGEWEESTGVCVSVVLIVVLVVIAVIVLLVVLSFMVRVASSKKSPKKSLKHTDEAQIDI